MEIYDFIYDILTCNRVSFRPKKRGCFVKSLIIRIFAAEKRMKEGADSPLFLFLTGWIMIDKELVKQLVEEKLASSGNYLVEVVVTPDNSITVEIDNDEGVNIDDCVALSRYLEECLDRDAEDYELEVGSTGLTSPFKTLRQYRKNIGNEVEMLLKSGVRLTGVLISAGETGAVIRVEKQVKPEGSKRKATVQEEQSYSFEEIKYTKYLLRFK